MQIGRKVIAPVDGWRIYDRRVFRLDSKLTNIRMMIIQAMTDHMVRINCPQMDIVICIIAVYMGMRQGRHAL